MDGAPNHNADVENLVAASKLVEDSGKESFWEPQDVQKAASDVEATASEPGGCRRWCIDVPFVSVLNSG